MINNPTYNSLIKKESKAFDTQTIFRKKRGLVPDIRKLKKNNFFFNNPYREPEFYKIQWYPTIEKIISIAKKNKKKKVLEIGCGTGFLSLELARNGLDVTGLDISKASIDLAKSYANKNKHNRGFGKLNYFVLDATYNKLNNKFDTIIFFRSLHHFPYPRKLFKNLMSMCTKKTKLIICEPMRSNFSELSTHFATITRFTLDTWLPHKKKISKNLNYNFFKKINEQIRNEYKYLNKGKKTQSPFDNSINDPKKLINLLSNNFKVKNVDYSDAFIDKLIGGLRGKNRFLVARFLKKYDEYLIKKKILNGTSLFLEATIK